MGNTKKLVMNHTMVMIRIQYTMLVRDFMAQDKNRDMQVIRELDMALEEVRRMFQIPIATGYGTIHTGNERGHCSFLRQQNGPIFYGNRKIIMIWLLKS
jgi:hypothetical protein